eukprot:scaffold136_cov325-Pavlova_lutheri.AAC.9
MGSWRLLRMYMVGHGLGIARSNSTAQYIVFLWRHVQTMGVQVGEIGAARHVRCFSGLEWHGIVWIVPVAGMGPTVGQSSYCRRRLHRVFRHVPFPQRGCALSGRSVVEPVGEFDTNHVTGIDP